MTDARTDHLLSLLLALDDLATNPDGDALDRLLPLVAELSSPLYLQHGVGMCTSSAVYTPSPADPVHLLAAALRSDNAGMALHLGGVLSAWRGDLVARWDRLEALCPAE
jgi:hypothetical protein